MLQDANYCGTNVTNDTSFLFTHEFYNFLICKILFFVKLFFERRFKFLEW